jgi:ABC-type transport system involved in multi-copper enzyme maturation permease subunit
MLLALAGMDLLLGVGTRINNFPTFDLGNVAVTMSFLGSLAIMGLSADAIAKERTSGTLDLILTRSISRRRIVAGKLLAYLIIAIPVSVLGVLLPMAAAAMLGVTVDLSRLPLELVIPGTALFLSVYAALGVAISLFCRSLQSAFALGGAIWVTTSPLVWAFLVLRGLQRHLDENALSWLNLLNPMGAYYSTIQHLEDFGVAEHAVTVMGGLSAPTWVAYGVLALELAIVVAFALLAFDRQEEPGYQT